MSNRYAFSMHARDDGVGTKLTYDLMESQVRDAGHQERMAGVKCDVSHSEWARQESNLHSQ